MCDPGKEEPPPAYTQQGAYPLPPQGQAYAPPQGKPYPQQQYPSGGAPCPPGQVVYTGHSGGVVMAQPVMVTPVNPFRESPVTTTCPHCHAHMTTNTSNVIGLMTWAAVGGACLIGCWLGCCLIPFCIDSMKDVVHTCPSCAQEVGRFKRIN